jgi:hypothetical protein
MLSTAPRDPRRHDLIAGRPECRAAVDLRLRQPPDFGLSPYLTRADAGQLGKIVNREPDPLYSAHVARSVSRIKPLKIMGSRSNPLTRR